MLTDSSIWSDKMKSIFGFSQGEFIGDFKQINERIHPDDRELVATASFSNRDDNNRYGSEFRVLLPDGTVRWLLMLGRTYSDINGTPTKLVGVSFDITARKKTEDDLRQALALRDEFISVAGHELNTPLTALALQMELLTRYIQDIDANNKDKILKTLNGCKAQLDRFSILTQDLINSSRAHNNRLEIKKAECNISELVKRVANLYEEKCIKANSKLVIKYDEAVIGNIDEPRIEQVLINLLSNALKFGLGKPIEVSLVSRENKAIIKVKDFGIGISKADQNKIFGRYERAVSVSNFGGLGLGLYIAKTIVQAHSGNISIDSELGNGATFTVELPL